MISLSRQSSSLFSFAISTYCFIASKISFNMRFTLQIRFIPNTLWTSSLKVFINRNARRWQDLSCCTEALKHFIELFFVSWRFLYLLDVLLHFKLPALSWAKVFSSTRSESSMQVQVGSCQSDKHLKSAKCNLSANKATMVSLYRAVLPCMCYRFRIFKFTRTVLRMLHFYKHDSSLLSSTVRDHGRRPAREWPTGIWRALNYPEIECI
jgi:hypothetical protein